MERKLVACAVALALGLLAAGCGSASGPLTRAAFMQRAGALCVHRRAVYTPIIARAHGNAIAAIRAALPEYEAFVKQLGALKPPASLRSAYTEILAFERRALAAWRSTLSGRLPNLHDDGPPLHRHEALRRELGMEACN
ncbi:MAG TPA: hypothetical protein VFU94_01180 [Conexibacter sp.]|nr:hypothetical protein [Conexibacter sp.]